jgi:hypothetical protein
MINLNVQKSKQIKFGIELSGILLQDIRGAVRITHEGIEYGFPISIDDDKLSVRIPPLEDVIINELKDQQNIDARLEIIAGDVYLTPWADTIKIEKPIRVEAVVEKIEDVKEKIKPDIKAKIVSDLDIKPKKKKIMENRVKKVKKKITEKQYKPKSKFSKMLQGK